MARKPKRGTRPRVRRRRPSLAMFLPPMRPFNTPRAAMCPWCVAKRGLPWPSGTTTAMCKRCRHEMTRGLHKRARGR